MGRLVEQLGVVGFDDGELAAVGRGRSAAAAHDRGDAAAQVELDVGRAVVADGGLEVQLALEARVEPGRRRRGRRRRGGRRRCGRRLGRATTTATGGEREHERRGRGAPVQGGGLHRPPR
jgi:hypothetical protein